MGEFFLSPFFLFLHFLSALLKQWNGEAVQKKEPVLRKEGFAYAKTDKNDKFGIATTKSVEGGNKLEKFR